MAADDAGVPPFLGPRFLVRLVCAADDAAGFLAAVPAPPPAADAATPFDADAVAGGAANDPAAAGANPDS